MIFYSPAIFVFLTFFVTGNTYEDATHTSDEENLGKSEILSRKKRFLVFPEGSSVQLVFCNTFPLNHPIGDILFFGYTAALAYELPQDPYSPFMHHADPLHRRVDNREIYYLDEDGRVIYKRPYSTKFIVNPAFAKRSVDSLTSGAENGAGLKKEQFLTNRKQMHSSASREFLKGDRMDRRSVEFHRTSRALLYRKIETMLEGLGGNGKECLLKTLCLVGQTQHQPQESFFQEILRVIFTLPKGSTEDEDIKEYDEAHRATESCDELFPGCNDPVNGPELASV